jgi:DNA processing protein
MRLPFDTTDPVLARAAWSRIVEPGDESAGAAVGTLGPSGALDWLCHAAENPGALAPHTRERVERWAPRLDGLDVRRELDVLARLGGRVVIPGDPGWPTALADLANATPFLLWIRSAAGFELDFAPGRSVAIVGSRASTRYGETLAAELALGLAEDLVAVVSGGAYGIDAAAHRGALAARAAPTVAVLAGGVDRLYPAGNEELLKRIAVEGALVAEVPPGSSPGRHRFLSRNRLIAALTGGTVVVEAGRRSGAISTANHASALLRPLGTVPGPVTSAASAGCHDLLRGGQAVCVTSVGEVKELILPMGEAAAEEPLLGAGLLDGLVEDQSRVLDALPARAAAEVESIARSAGLSPREVRSALGLLELAGKVRRSGNRWGRVAS